MRRSSAGFTLLEMLLALAILALLGLMASRMLLQSLTLNQAAGRHGQRLAEIQYAFALIERDFFAILPEPVRGEGEFAGAPLWGIAEGNGSDRVVFTHAGWPNPGDRLPRSELQRVGYRMEGGELVREYFDYPNIAEGAHRQRLLSDISALRLNYWSEGRWSPLWQERSTLPQAVEVSLTLRQGGTLIRRFILPGAQ